MKKMLFIFCITILLFAYNTSCGKKEKLTASPSLYDKIVVLETNQGVIEIKLWPSIAPKACENFVKLVQRGYYDGIIFHRVIKGFMIQGGDPTGTGMGGESCWGTSFEDEVQENVKFDKVGLVAMANAGPNTNGSQFFITTSKPSYLNMKHTIFGEVVNGYDVVQKIEGVKTNENDKPVVEQKIIRAYIKGEEKLKTGEQPETGKKSSL